MDDFNNNEGINLSKTPDESENNENVNISESNSESAGNDGVNLSKTPEEPDNNESVNLFKEPDEPDNSSVQGESHAQSQPQPQQNVSDNPTPAPAQPNQVSSPPIYNNIYVEQPKNNSASGLAITSLVLGILSILGGCCCNIGLAFIPLNLPLAIAGLITGILQNKKEKSGLAMGGIVTSAIGLVLGLVCLIIWILALIGVMATPDYHDYY